MTLKYRPEVDGLRAIAILPVVLYHAKVPAFSGGFVGVDVFFVISGYLIATIILTEWREGRFSLLGFYRRRVLRIFPALFVMMAACYPIGWLLLGPGGMKEFAGSIVASTFFFANIYFLGVSGYFATAAELKPLLHNWSLSVEEQFYMLLPAIMLLTWRLGARLQAALLLLVAVLSLGIAEWQVQQGNTAPAFFLLQARMWELLAGVLAAYWLASPAGQRVLLSGRYRHLALLGIALILFAVFTFNGNTPFPGLAALLPCAGAAAVIIFATPSTLAGALLGWRPMVFIGLISYSLYLWHYPLLAFTRIATESENLALMLGICLFAGVLAYLSWRFVERPARRLQLSHVRLFGSAAAAMVVLGGFGAAGFATDGYRDLYLRYRLDAATRDNYQRYQHLTIRDSVANGECQFRISDIALEPEDEALFETCAAKFGKAVVVLGDSHAGNIYRTLRSTGRYPFLVGMHKGGCRPINPKPDCPYNAARQLMAEHGSQISQLVFHVSGSHFILDHLGRADNKAAFVEGNPATIFTPDVAATAAYVASLPPGPDIVWLGPFAEARVDFENPENFSPARLRFNRVSLDLFKKLDDLLKAEAAGQHVFRYVSLVDVLRFDKDSLLIGDCMTFADVDHLSSCAENMFGPAIADSLTPPG
jgi:peptidoglycan/LPS O-acetylase OafA/YrhL